MTYRWTIGRDESPRRWGTTCREMPRMHINLVYFRPDGERKDIPLHGSEVLLGRAEDCNLRIPLAAVSRQHCRIIIGNDEVLVEDLGSANGTYVNTQRVSRKTLYAGDRLGVGQAA